MQCKTRQTRNKPIRRPLDNCKKDTVQMVWPCHISQQSFSCYLTKYHLRKKEETVSGENSITTLRFFKATHSNRHILQCAPLYLHVINQMHTHLVHLFSMGNLYMYFFKSTHIGITSIYFLLYISINIELQFKNSLFLNFTETTVN